MQKQGVNKEAQKELESKPAQMSRVTSLPETARGVYANIALIKHTPREFIFDFMLGLEEDVQLVSRVIMSPAHTKSFLDALKLNIQKYESTFEQKNSKR